MKIISLYINKFRIIESLDMQLNSNEIYVIGENGSGKSTILEAIAEIFAHLYSLVGNFTTYQTDFDFIITYSIGEHEVQFTSYDTFTVDDNEVSLAQFREINAQTPLLPNNIFLYYAGITDRLKSVSDLFLDRYRRQLAQMKDTELADKVPALSPFIYADGGHLDITFAALMADNNLRVRDKLGLHEDCHIKMEFCLRKPKSNKEGGTPDQLWGERSIVILDFVRQLIDVSESYNSEDSNRLSITVESLGLASLAKDLEGKGRYIYQMLEFLRYRGMLEEVRIYWDKENGETVSLNYLSEGEKQAILSICATDIWGDNDMLLLLDEPDTFLHPRWQNTFVSEVAERLGSNQLFVTTHSSLMLSSIKEGQLFTMHEGQISEFLRRTYGMDSTSLLRIAMGASEREKGVNDLMDEIVELCDSGEIEEAKSKLSILESATDENNKEVMQMKAYITRTELFKS